MESQFLLGLRVERSSSLGRPGQRQSYYVWSGTTEAARQRHAEAIRAEHRAYDDGELTLDLAQSPIVIDEPGFYVGPGAPMGLRIERIAGPREAFGYRQRLDKRGELRDGTLEWVYLNGMALRPADSQVIVTEKISPSELRSALLQLRKGN